MASSLLSFFICNNPTAIFADTVVCHIYHDAKPRFKAVLFKADPDKFMEINSNGINYPFAYVRGDRQEQLFVIVIRDMIDRSTMSKFSHALQQAAAWYATCLNKVDEKIYGTGLWTTFADYNQTMPGIQVVHVERSGTFLLFHPAGVRTFKSNEDLDQFLENKLNYPVAHGLEVNINVHR